MATLTVFDLDDTLFKTKANVKVVRNGKVMQFLSSAEFNNYKLQDGEDFDFSEFRSSAYFKETSVPIKPMITKLKQIAHNKNSKNSDTIIVTARSDFDDRDLFLTVFKELEIDLNRIHIVRSGNIGGGHSTAQKKMLAIADWLDEGIYDRVRMYDDNIDNLKAFMYAREVYTNIKFEGFLVLEDLVLGLVP